MLRVRSVGIVLLSVGITVMEFASPSTAIGQQGFFGVGSMSTDRVDQKATLLDDGRVLVTGGSSLSSGFLSSAELYVHERRRFGSTGSMGGARSEHAATLLADGRVLVSGGGAGPLASAEIYDPTTGAFSPVSDMVTPRVQHAALLLEEGLLSGKVLVIGGDQGGAPTATVELFDPTTGTFVPVGALNTPRTLPSAIPFNDGSGRVLIVGGYTGNREALASAEVFEPQTMTFSATGSMAIPRIWATATALSNGQILVAGGVEDGWALTALASAELYDPQSGTFSLAGSMGSSRWRHAAARLRDGRVIVTGGAGATWPSALETTEVYDPSTGNFSNGPALQQARTSHTITTLANGKIIVVGGYDGVSSFLSSAELLNSVPGRLDHRGR